MSLQPDWPRRETKNSLLPMYSIFINMYSILIQKIIYFIMLQRLRCIQVHTVRMVQSNCTRVKGRYFTMTKSYMQCYLYCTSMKHRYLHNDHDAEQIYTYAVMHYSTGAAMYSLHLNSYTHTIIHNRHASRRTYIHTVHTYSSCTHLPLKYILTLALTHESAPHSDDPPRSQPHHPNPSPPPRTLRSNPAPHPHPHPHVRIILSLTITSHPQYSILCPRAAGRRRLRAG